MSGWFRHRPLGAVTRKNCREALPSTVALALFALPCKIAWAHNASVLSMICDSTIVARSRLAAVCAGLSRGGFAGVGPAVGRTSYHHVVAESARQGSLINKW
jgi:hypothetical protein